MRNIINPTAWVSVFSTLLFGCYSPAVISPVVGQKERLCNTLEIFYVVTKDGTKYVFDNPPVVANDTIFGQVTPKAVPNEISIPLSDVVQIGQSQSAAIEYVVTKAGTKYTFVKTPAIVNKTILGEIEAIPLPPVPVAIPLSDVIEASVSEFDGEKTGTTAAGVVLVLLAVGVIVAGIADSIGSSIMRSN